MTYSYKTKGTCSTQIDLELDGNVVHNVKFTGGIRCGGRPTSCGDQLAKACREALEASQNA